MSNLTAKVEIKINASASDVWDALINPATIKKYLFGTDTITDWKVGSPINFKGVWEGKEYLDKGYILKNEKEKLLQYSYYSSFSSLEDKPENYSIVTFELTPQNNLTLLSLTQGNIKTEESRQHSEQNWNYVLNTLKEILESESKK